jgi:Cof subfamily protein (haloacid dehalogenase superfamily)
MTFPFKAIFVDLDGTLLNSKKEISSLNLDCLNKFIENGIDVIIATGRTIKSVRKVTKGLNLKSPIITLNGSNIHNQIDGYAMSVSYIENSLKDHIFEFCRRSIENFNIKNILVDTANYFFVLNPHNLDLEEFMNHYDTPPKLLDLNNPPEDSVVSFLFLLEDEAQRIEFINSHNQFLPQKVKLCTFNGWPWIEIGSPNTNKGSAMEFVCEHLGIECKDVIAFGDGHNDVEMLQNAGLGVAMANSDNHALNAAKTKTKSHDDDGVAWFLYNLKSTSLNAGKLIYL